MKHLIVICKSGRKTLPRPIKPFSGVMDAVDPDTPKHLHFVFPCARINDSAVQRKPRPHRKRRRPFPFNRRQGFYDPQRPLRRVKVALHDDIPFLGVERRCEPRRGRGFTDDLSARHRSVGGAGELDRELGRFRRIVVAADHPHHHPFEFARADKCRIIHPRRSLTRLEPGLAPARRDRARLKPILGDACRLVVRAAAVTDENRQRRGRIGLAAYHPEPEIAASGRAEFDLFVGLFRNRTIDRRRVCGGKESRRQTKCHISTYPQVPHYLPLCAALFFRKLVLEHELERFGRFRNLTFLVPPDDKGVMIAPGKKSFHELPRRFEVPA